MPYLSDDSLRVRVEVQPREAQYFPPEQRDVVLPFAIAGKHLSVAVERPTVDFDGHIYTAQRDNVSRVNHFSPTGALLDFIADPGVGGFADIDINRNGQLVIASHGGMLLVTTKALDSIISFQTRASSGVNFASWIPTPIPEPSAIALLASGIAFLAGRIRSRR